MKLEIGHAKNDNKYPVAERAIQELEDDLLRQDSSSAAVSLELLSVETTTALIARIRSRGRSVREMWTQSDQFTNSQIPVVDQTIILNKHKDASRSTPTVCGLKPHSPKPVIHRPS